MMYCLDALPLTKKQEQQLDNLQLQYVRWCLGLSNKSGRIDTVAETGQKPVSLDIAKARIKYYVLLRSRPVEHITTAALHHFMETDKRQGSWYCSVRRDMSLWGCEEWHTAAQLDISMKSGRGGKEALARSIGRACWQQWQKLGAGDLPHLPSWLLDRPDYTLEPFLGTHVSRVHMYDHRSNRMYMSVCANNFSVCAPYLRVFLSKCVLRAFCLFRLGLLVHLNAHDGRKKHLPVLARTCDFCQRVCGQRVVEDAYHVCMECPLYDSLRLECARPYVHLCMNVVCERPATHPCCRPLPRRLSGST